MRRNPIRVLVRARAMYMDGLSLYTYVRGNSPGLLDPSGRQCRIGNCPDGDIGCTNCDWSGPGGDPWCEPHIHRWLWDPERTCVCAHEVEHCNWCNYFCGPQSCCDGGGCIEDEPDNCLTWAQHECNAFAMELVCYENMNMSTRDNNIEHCMADCMVGKCDSGELPPSCDDQECYAEAFDACAAECYP